MNFKISGNSSEELLKQVSASGATTTSIREKTLNSSDGTEGTSQNKTTLENNPNDLLGIGYIRNLKNGFVIKEGIL